MSNIHVLDAIRTPRGTAKETGSLHSVTPTGLLAGILRALQQRTRLDTEQVSDAVFGCVTQTGEQGGNIGKSASLLAGWSPHMSAVTINRFCASGLSAVNFASQQARDSDMLAVGGGVEMMSRVPMFGDQPAYLSDKDLASTIGFVPPPWSSDLVATRHGFSRSDCDSYAALSQSRALAARTAGLARSMVPVVDAQGHTLLDQDENIRANNTLEKLASLRTVYEDGANGLDAWGLAREPELGAIHHVHTAGNAPCMADGAAAMRVSCLLDEMELRDLRYGVAALPGAFGVATATVFERVQTR